MAAQDRYVNASHHKHKQHSVLAINVSPVQRKWKFVDDSKA